MTNRLSRTATLLAGTVVAAGTAMAQSDNTSSDVTIANAQLMTVDGQPAGNVEFTQTPNGVLIEVLVSNVTPGVHAIHLHDTGECSGDFTSAGSHIAMGGSEHGFLNEDGPHAGDLPNIVVSPEGVGTAVFYNSRIGLNDGGGETDLLAGNGSAVIVHEFGDTYNEESDTGSRVACGVIEARA